jgi:hypothetical protein
MLIPKFKQQLIFLKEREKLFKTKDDSPNQFINSSPISSKNTDLLSISSTNSNLSTISSTNSNLSTISSANSDSSSSSQGANNDYSPKESMKSLPVDQVLVHKDASVLFPNEYTIPSVPNSLLKDIEEGALNTFGPHYSNRQILIDAVVFDLTQNYKLL